MIVKCKLNKASASKMLAKHFNFRLWLYAVIASQRAQLVRESDSLFS